MSKYIRLEPRKHYDKAIIKQLKSGKLVYSYHQLVEITKKNYFNSYPDAIEWTDYNICGYDGTLLKIDYTK